MGTKSKVFRYREAGEGTNEINVEKYGKPVNSLFMSSKIISLHQKNTIVNDKEEVIYKNETKVWTMHDTTFLKDASDAPVATIRRKFISLHHTHFIKMENGKEFKIRQEFWHIWKKVINIEGLGWQINGNMFALNFTLHDANGDLIALVSQKVISIHDKYCIDIYKKEYEPEVVAICVALQHLIRDEERAASSSTTSYND